MAGIAAVNSSGGGMDFGGPADFSPLQLTVSDPGVYLVFARVTMSNYDGDSQNASARISHDEEYVIDRVDVRMLGKTRTSISLQGTLRVDAQPKKVNLRCSTFRGGAHQSSMFAVPVSDIKAG